MDVSLENLKTTISENATDLVLVLYYEAWNLPSTQFLESFRSTFSSRPLISAYVISPDFPREANPDDDGDDATALSDEEYEEEIRSFLEVDVCPSIVVFCEGARVQIERPKWDTDTKIVGVVSCEVLAGAVTRLLQEWKEGVGGVNEGQRSQDRCLFLDC